MRVWIDAGHGMGNRKPGLYDPGAVSGELTEAQIALQVALIGRTVLIGLGHEVGLTRDDNRDPSPVGTRDDRAEAWEADVFISLHLNAAGNTAANGTETFYRDNADKELAERVQQAALAAFGLRNRGLKSEGASQHGRLAVFDFSGPACLAELGFVSNKADVAAIMQPQAARKFWQLIAEGLQE
jgi:N-acetylmuramoyl-L-alanine amidase